MAGPPNVIFVVLDTVRADRVSALGYERDTTPRFDAFASNATLFTDAVAQAPWSVPSHASMFTGEYPTQHETTTAKPILTAGPTLAECLSEAGYETYAVSPNEYIRPAMGFARGFDEFYTPARLTEPAITADLLAPVVNRITSSAAVRRPVERAFNAIRRSGSTTTQPAAPADDMVLDPVRAVTARADDPFFLFVNLMDAHLPRSPAPEHAERFVDSDLSDVPIVENERAQNLGDVELTPAGFRRLSQLYDADLKTLDDRFGRLLDLLFETGALSDSLVVVVSDHGEHLGEFGLVGHQFSVFDSTVSVPLAIQFPEGGPDRIDDQVEIRRLFQTILDETGVESCPEQSLASGTGDTVARGSYHSPMVDIETLLADRDCRYDRKLLGEPLGFARTPTTKLISFDGGEWLFELPERGKSSIERAAESDAYDRLREYVPAAQH